MASNAKHSAASVEHYSPPDVMQRARDLLRGIELDVASCELANRTVRAERFFTREDDALTKEWRARTAFANPPGGKDGSDSLAKLFWQKFVTSWARGDFESGVFLFFSIEAFQTTQVDPVGPLPLKLPFCVPARRLEFLRATEALPTRQEALFADVAEPVLEGVEPGDSPTHANAIVYLPSAHDWLPIGGGEAAHAVFRRRDLSRFATFFLEVGQCVNTTEARPRMALHGVTPRVWRGAEATT